MDGNGRRRTLWRKIYHNIAGCELYDIPQELLTRSARSSGYLRRRRNVSMPRPASMVAQGSGMIVMVTNLLPVRSLT